MKLNECTNLLGLISQLSGLGCSEYKLQHHVCACLYTLSFSYRLCTAAGKCLKCMSKSILGCQTPDWRTPEPECPDPA